jgi:uncharacterized membrane protein (UPF0182 family)
MRAPTDMPRRRRRGSNRGRIVLIVAVVALFLLATSLRGIAGFYTDYLWFDGLGLASVFRGVLRAQVVLAAVFTATFFVLLFVNLWIADRLAPKFRPAGPEDDLLERYHDVVDRRAGLLRAGISLVFALLFGLGAGSQWNEWLLFSNSVSFGEKDPLFNTDISFYVFKLPFLTYLVNWLFASLIIIFIVTAVAHYLNGGIRVQAAFQRVTPQVKAHLSVILGLLALVKAADYWLDRYELTLSTRGTVDGATYTEVNAQLPAIYLLLSISLLAFVLFIINIWRRGWVLPAVTVGLWAFAAIVAGTIYPTFVQRFRVEPAESSKEATYITRNIEATRDAFGLNNVETTPFDYQDSLESEQLLANEGTIQNIRLLDPNVVTDTYRRLQNERGFYRFLDLDVDRYTVDINGEEITSQVVIAARELNPDGIPQKSWEGERLAFTHGYGIALAPSNVVTSTGRPDFLIGGVPIVVSPTLPETDDIAQPQLYFGDGLPGYSIVGTERVEIDYTDEAGEPVETAYDGDGGVAVSGTGIGGFIRRSAFALRFGEIDPLISNFITDKSRILYVRDVRERVTKVAPFLHIDADPYPVVTSDGNMVWIIDAYTTSSNYPYAQRANTEQLSAGSGLDHNFNYVRNSVKVVVDAYDGTVTLYEMPGIEGPDGEVARDPIAQAYRKAFPDLFEDFDDMPEDLQEHLRYPEDLFRVQTNMWGRYQISESTPFYEQAGAWTVAQDPGTTPEGAESTPVTNAQGETVSTRDARIEPYYLQMQLPDQEGLEFVLLRPFVPVSQNDTNTQLTAFMVAQSDGDNYGKLRVYQMPGTRVDGPAVVQANIAATEEISQRVSLLNQQGSQVRFGNLLLVPIDQTILYVRPLYVQARGETAVPELKNVIVAFGAEVAMGTNLLDALTQIFDSEEDIAALEEILGGELTPPTDPDEGPDEPPEETPDQTVDELLAEASTLLEEAESELQGDDPDLGAYQDKVDQARELINQALELTGAVPPSDGGSDGDGTADGSTTTAPPDTEPPDEGGGEA